MKYFWMPFETAAWKKDMRRHPPEVQGNWINAICSIWDTGRLGVLSMTIPEWALELGISEEKTNEFMTYLKNHTIADVTFCNGDVTNSNGQGNAIVTVKSRRIEKWFKGKYNTALRVAKHRQKIKSNKKVTSNVTVHSKNHNKSNNNKKDKEVLKEDNIKDDIGKGIEIIKERILTPVQKIIEEFKKVKGYDLIKNWNKVNFARYTPAAKSLLSMAENEEIAIRAIKPIGEYCDGQKWFNWTLETVVKKFPDLITGKLERTQFMSNVTAGNLAVLEKLQEKYGQKED